MSSLEINVNHLKSHNVVFTAQAFYTWVALHCQEVDGRDVWQLRSLLKDNHVYVCRQALTDLLKDDSISENPVITEIVRDIQQINLLDGDEPEASIIGKLYYSLPDNVDIYVHTFSEFMEHIDVFPVDDIFYI